MKKVKEYLFLFLIIVFYPEDEDIKYYLPGKKKEYPDLKNADFDLFLN